MSGIGFALTLMTTVCATALQAQVATVQGRVMDEEGSAVYGATVLIQQGDGTIAATDTDRLGSFRMTGVPPGDFTVRVLALGYAPYEEPIDVGEWVTIELDLRLARQAIEVEGISVEAERSRERVRFEEMPGATVREVAVEDVRMIPGVAEPDPVRAVEVLPGVVSTSDFSASFNVRGGSADQNLILLDGIPIFSPFHLGGLFSVFNSDMLDRAELQSGGFPAEHGGRVSSVLEIETDAGSGDFEVDAGISLLATRVAVGGGLSDDVESSLGLADLKWRGSFRRSYFDVLFKPAFDFPYHLTDFQGAVEGWTESGDRITVTAYTGADVLDLTTLEPEDFPLRIEWDWGNDIFGASWSRARRGGGSLKVAASYSAFGTGLGFPDFADTEFRSHIDQTRVAVDLDTRPTPTLSVQAGGTAERFSYDNLFSTGGTVFGEGRGTGVLLGSYLQAAWSKPGEWLVQAGLRSDVWSPDPGDVVFEPSPRFAVKRFLAGGDIAVKVAAGRYTQFLHSLRDEELPLGLDIWVLSGERAPAVVSDQIQVGIEGFQDIDWYWSLEAFARGFDGVVTFNPAEDPNDELDDIIAGDGISYGADLLVRRETGDVTGWLALSFVKAERTFTDFLSPFQPSPEITYAPIFDRRVDVDLVLRYPAPWGWEGGLRWNVGSGTPYTRALGGYDYYESRYGAGQGLLRPSDDFDTGVLLEDRNASRYPVYHRLDVSFRKEMDKSWGSLTPYVNLVNVYNQRNVLFYFFEYDRTPPTRSGVSMFPVLPTFGVEVRF